MNEESIPRRRMLGLLGAGVTSGCLDLQSDSSRAESSDGAESESAGTNQPPTTTTQSTSEARDRPLSENWSVSLGFRDRYVHLTDSYAVLSANGVRALSLEDGSEVYHAFREEDVNRTHAVGKNPFVSFGDRILARATNHDTSADALLSVGPDGSEVESRTADVPLNGPVKVDDSVIVHVPNMREHEVSAEGVTDVCSVGGGRLETVTASLETTNVLSLPDEMCAPMLQFATPKHYVAKTDTYLTVLSRDSTAVLWRRPLEVREMCVHEGTLYLSTLNDGLLALDVETGEEVWRLGQPLGQLHLHDGVLYGAQVDTVAIDTETNDVLWRGQKRSDPLGQPKVVDGTLIVATEEYIYGYNPADGTLVHRSPLPKPVTEEKSASARIDDSGLHFKSESKLRQYSLKSIK